LHKILPPLFLLKIIDDLREILYKTFTFLRIALEAEGRDEVKEDLPGMDF
jgi:hypothetical protein